MEDCFDKWYLLRESILEELKSMDIEVVSCSVPAGLYDIRIDFKTKADVHLYKLSCRTRYIKSRPVTIDYYLNRVPV